LDPQEDATDMTFGSDSTKCIYS